MLLLAGAVVPISPTHQLPGMRVSGMGSSLQEERDGGMWVADLPGTVEKGQDPTSRVMYPGQRGAGGWG